MEYKLLVEQLYIWILLENILQLRVWFTREGEPLNGIVIDNPQEDQCHWILCSSCRRQLLYGVPKQINTNTTSNSAFVGIIFKYICLNYLSQSIIFSEAYFSNSLRY
jgi:hypothetical protein